MCTCAPHCAATAKLALSSVVVSASRHALILPLPLILAWSTSFSFKDSDDGKAIEQIQRAALTDSTRMRASEHSASTINSSETAAGDDTDADADADDDEADEAEEEEDGEGRRANTSETMQNSAGREPTAAVAIVSPVETIALCAGSWSRD